MLTLKISERSLKGSNVIVLNDKYLRGLFDPLVQEGLKMRALYETFKTVEQRRYGKMHEERMELKTKKRDERRREK